MKIKSLLLSLLMTWGTGIVSSIIVYANRDEARPLYQPALTPPDWVFPVVWTILFTLMGIGTYFIYISDSSQRMDALKINGLQLFTNFCWTVLFFGFHSYFIAFLCLIILWILVLGTLIRYYQINRTAGILYVPYLLWLTFAGYLNLAIAYYNF